MKKLIAALLLLLPFYAAIAQSNFSMLDSLLSQYDKSGTPGVSMRIVKDGKIIYNKHAGYADIKDNKHLSDKSVFYLASVSKQFTGACIVLLEQQGKLKFDDILSKYFPDFPEYTQKITIKDLLNHTAGVKDIATLAGLRGENFEDYTDEQIKKLLIRQNLNFEPGTNHSYSNSGYWFLARIVEQVAGMSIADYAEANIFKPLKMVNTSYVLRGDKKSDNSAIGYKPEDGNYTETLVDARAVSGAGVYSTVGDLQLWLQEMDDKKILGKTFWGKMFNKDIYKDEGFIYSKGLMIYDHGRHKEISHGGDNDGFHTYIALYPNDKLSIITLSNNDEVSAEMLNTVGANAVFGIDDEEAYSTENTEIMPDSLLSQYEGLYNDNGYFYLVEHNQGMLGMVQVFNDTGYGLDPVNNNTFRKAYVDFIFEDIVEGKAQKMIIDTGKSKDVAVRKVIAQGAISKCIGTFYSDTLDVEYTLYEENGSLKCRIGPDDVTDAEFVVYKVVLDRGSLKLDFAENGSVTGFMLNHSRAKNIKFVKKV